MSNSNEKVVAVSPLKSAEMKMNSNISLSKEDVIVLMKEVRYEVKTFEELTLSDLEYMSHQTAITGHFNPSTDDEHSLYKDVHYINGVIGQIYGAFESLYVGQNGLERDIHIGWFIDRISEARVYYNRLVQLLDNMGLSNYSDDGTPDQSESLPF